MSEIFESEASEHSCPHNGFSPCRGAKCMGWAWTGRPFDRTETDNITDTPEGPRPQGVPPMPEGDGWEMEGDAFGKGYHRSAKENLPKATAQRWVRPVKVVKGICGLSRHTDNHRGDYF